MAQQKKEKSLIAKSQSYFGDYLLMLLALCVPAVYYCGRRAVFVLLASVGTAVFCDLTGGLLFYNKILLRDLCAVFTGTAIALMMPPTVPEVGSSATNKAKPPIALPEEPVPSP